MTTTTGLPGGVYEVAGLGLTRVGYGTMQLPGKGVFGPPRDRAEALAVLRAAVHEYGITNIDTADFYGPDVANELIREALSPYPDDLVIITKVGSERDAKGAWVHADSPDDLRDQVQRNLSTLGLESLPVVNLRVLGEGEGGSIPVEHSIAEPFEVLADLREQGLIQHLGLSTVTAQQVAEARTIAPVVCVQNFYNLANRGDDDLIDALADDGIAYVPYFPLGGFSPLQADALSAVADRLGASRQSVALAWLLQRSPNVLLIPGTSSVAHLRENVEGAGLELPADAIAELNSVAG